MSMTDVCLIQFGMPAGSRGQKGSRPNHFGNVAYANDVSFSVEVKMESHLGMQYFRNSLITKLISYHYHKHQLDCIIRYCFKNKNPSHEPLPTSCLELELSTCGLKSDDIHKTSHLKIQISLDLFF